MKNKAANHIILLIILCTTLSTGCSDLNKTEILESTLSIGTYQEEDSPDILKPKITLEKNNEFIFTYSALSSYLPIGTYEIHQNSLILNTEDGKNKYLFEIQDDTLVFDKENSSPVTLSNLTDGAIFSLLDDDNE